MQTTDIIYFDQPGSRNTAAVLSAVRKRVAGSPLKYVVVASNSGKTGMEAWELLHDLGVNIVSVSEHAGFTGCDKLQLSDQMKADLEAKGVKTLVCSHALSGVGRAISKQFGGVSPVEMIAHTLRLFGGEGIKVAVEISIMAADAGLVPTDQEIVAIGGTRRGADAAIILKAAHMNTFFDLEIREIIAKPRQRG